jgi:hypothetical protein
VADIVAVLVVPAEGDPCGLLAYGPCGSKPPKAHPTRRGWEEASPLLAVPIVGTSEMASAMDGAALPLWWDEALVPEGWDRARRVAYRTQLYTEAHGGERGEFVDLALHDGRWAPDIVHIVEVAEAMVRAGLASRVVRLARVDGRLVEVSP